jgi:glycosyltransferase involved in cell wall biosynthesis
MLICAHFPLPETTGGRKRTARLIQAIQRAGLAPVVLTDAKVTEEGLHEARARGWRVEAFPAPPWTVGARLTRQLRREPAPTSNQLVARLRLVARDAVFVQAEEMWAAHYLLRLRGSVPTVASMYNVDSTARIDPYAPALPRSRRELAHRVWLGRMASVERRVTRAATATLCVSEADRRHFDRLGASRTLLVPNGVDEDLLSVASHSVTSKDVLFFGTLSYPPNERGIVDFVQHAWPMAAAADPDARLRIAGSAATALLIGVSSRAPRVEILGFVPSLHEELARARCVVAPIPFGGGTRIKVLEALAAATPVVGTPVGVEGIGFQHGVHGFVGETSEEMGRYVTQLLADPDLAGRMGEAGRRMAGSYTWERTLSPAQQLYGKLLDTPHRAS